MTSKVFSQKLQRKVQIFEQQIKFGSINHLLNEDINIAQSKVLQQQVLMAELLNKRVPVKRIIYIMVSLFPVSVFLQWVLLLFFLGASFS